jgi:hypothetical protein
MSAEGVSEGAPSAKASPRLVSIQISSTPSVGLNDDGSIDHAAPNSVIQDGKDAADHGHLIPASEVDNVESDSEEKEKGDLVPEPRIKSRTASLLDMAFLHNNDNEDALRRMSNQSDSTIPDGYAVVIILRI